MNQLALVENDTYYFDPVAAELPITFAETYGTHYQGRNHAGKPFLLLEWQKQLIRSLFGWKRRSDGLRRFRELYLISAKGAGKTPLLAILGLYMLLADSEPGAHVISIASTFEQANYVFDFAKNCIDKNETLKKHCDVKQLVIYASKKSKWNTVSGKPNGKSGSVPSCVIADEIHEWAGWTFEALEMVCKNQFKRAQPLLLIATNAGSSKSGNAWKVHERALRVLNGELDDPTVLPYIYEADESLEWTSEEAAAQANPSLGSFIKFEQLKAEIDKAKSDPEKEGVYKRLYLTQWASLGTKWLNMALVEAAMQPFDVASLKDAALYVGLDIGLSDDLTAISYCYCTPEKTYIDVEYLMPKSKAEQYQRHDGTQYLEWAKAGSITLIDEPTISNKTLIEIANRIIERGKRVPIKVVSYDAYRSNHTVATLDAAGITTVATRQGYTLMPGCEELDRRLKEQSIQFAPNPVTRFCAENAEITSDQRGNYWIIKPGAKGKGAGKRGAKVDGIVATVNALVEARKHTFPKQSKSTAPKMWVI